MPDAENPGNSPKESRVDHGIEFLKLKFLQKNKYPQKPIYLHVTCATDTSSIATVFNAVRDIIYRSLLESSAM